MISPLSLVDASFTDLNIQIYCTAIRQKKHHRTTCPAGTVYMTENKREPPDNLSGAHGFSSAQDAYAMGFAVRHVEHAVGEEHRVRAVQLRVQRIVLWSIPHFASPEDRGDISSFEVNAADGVT